MIQAIIGITFLCVFLESCGVQKKTTNVRSRESYTGVIEKYAQKMNVDHKTLQNAELYFFIDQWYNTPYQYGGTSKTGIDCSGFVGALYREVYGINLPRTTNDIDHKSKKTNGSKLSEGDLIFFDINGKKSSHIGVFLVSGYFVHASSSKGVIISNLSNPYYQKAFGKAAKIESE